LCGGGSGSIETCPKPNYQRSVWFSHTKSPQQWDIWVVKCWVPL